MANLCPSERADQAFQTARIRFERDHAAFLAAVRTGARGAEAVALGCARLEARAQAPADWATDLKVRHGHG